MVHWYASGAERATEAELLITKLIASLDFQTAQPLITVLESGRNELTQPTQSLTLILSRLQLSIAQCLLKHPLVLDPSTQVLFTELTALSAIRYGG
ncbi:hypothetical protein [Brochothrix campestris]|uniref:Immunity protein n=1 Tax=Brochothrix campestris FSL F6-1037 TaxID=1265861 RepID=W7CQN2_9LIST|nr:hypothetical protein [Brochothrix campestris]EUJ38026.1 immunity protein [Brochothrix campestris FSL F6-1037]